VPGPDAVVVLIAEDPRVSHRANEAMRIGLGIVAGENELTLILCGPAVHLLDANTDDLIDGDDVARFRASLAKLGIPFHVERAAIPADPGWNPDGHRIVPVSAEDIATLLRQGRRSLVF
jgi:hypothetical protein